MDHTTKMDYGDWWAATWREKETIIGRAYGSGRPESVIAYYWEDIDLRIPGACALAFGPAAKTKMRHIVTSYGLSQPMSPEAVGGPRSPSGEGYEIGFATTSEVRWAVGVIQQLLTYVRQSSAVIGRGDRLPVWFRNSSEGVLGKPNDGDVPFGLMRWIVVWTDLMHPTGFESTTGYFNVYLCTAITQEEWVFAKRTSSAHILLLLAECGCDQISEINRECAVCNPRYHDHVRRILKLSQEHAEEELIERFSLG